MSRVRRMGNRGAAALLLLFLCLPTAVVPQTTTITWVGDGFCTSSIASPLTNEYHLADNGQSCLARCDALGTTCLGVAMPVYNATQDCTIYTSDHQVDGADGDIDHKCFKKTTNRQMALLPAVLFFLHAILCAVISE